MKLTISALVAATLAVAAVSSVQAAGVGSPVNGTFNVAINLTSACKVTNAASAMSFSYTSFQTSDATASTSLNVKCTNTLPFTLSLDTTSHTDAKTGLAYTLALPVTTDNGTGSDVAYTVNGTIAAGQAGTCASSTCSNSGGSDVTRTLYVAY